jgi:hypothetical protein
LLFAGFSSTPSLRKAEPSSRTSISACGGFAGSIRLPLMNTPSPLAKTYRGQGSGSTKNTPENAQV